MPLFDVDFKKVVTNVLPVRLRSAVMQAWLNVLAGPVVYTYNLFMANRAANLYRLAHNGQVVYLQAVLNDTFDPIARTITIGDAPFVDVVPVYLVAEAKPLAIYLGSENKPVPLYTANEVAMSISGFIVFVPVAVAPFDVNRMKALIDVYRLVGMNNYAIERV